MKKMKADKKFMVVLIAVIVVFLTALTLLSNVIGKKETIPAVATVKVTRGDLSEKLDTTGNVESQNKKTFFSPVNATIEMLGMKAGDSVKAGTKLVAFDLDDLEKQNQKAEISVKMGQYDYADVVNSAGRAADKQATAAANVSNLQGQVEAQQQYVKDLKDAINDVAAKAQKDAKKAAKEAAKSAEAAAKAQRKAIMDAYKEELDIYNTVTKPAYEKELADLLEQVNKAYDSGNQAAYDAAFVNYEYAINHPPLPPVQPDVSGIVPSAVQPEASAGAADTYDLQAELEAASADLAELQQELAQQKAIAEADVAGVSEETKAKLNLSSNLSELDAKSLEELIADGKKGIAAEFNGVISDCTVTEGAAVSQGMQLFTLQSTDEVSVNISVSKYDYDKIKEGQKAIITMADNTYHGTVEKVNRIALPNEKGTPMIGAVVRIDDPDENIFLGVEAKVVVSSADVKGTLMVPSEAVNIGKDGSFCYVIEDGIIVKKNIVTGISSADAIEIKEGLSEGQDVLTDIGIHAEGDKVQPLANVTK